MSPSNSEEVLKMIYLAYTQKDPNIKGTIQNGMLHLTHIKEPSLKLLEILRIDPNESFVSLLKIDVSISKDGKYENVSAPGLTDFVKNSYNNSKLPIYRSGGRSFLPFSALNEPLFNNGIATIPKLTDLLTSIPKFGQNTTNNIKLYSILLGESSSEGDLKTPSTIFNSLKSDVKTKKTYTGYTGKYALCTSAKCVKSYDNNTKKEILNCYCDVNEGPAVGLNTGINFDPYSSGGNNYVYSLYSGYNGKDLAKQKCNSGTWGDCLNQVCKVDPLNPNKAYCYCKSLTSNPWITFQNKNKKSPSSCNNLSGALNQDYETINQYYKVYSFQK
jgi:hypothetical protein